MVGMEMEACKLITYKYLQHQNCRHTRDECETQNPGKIIVCITHIHS